MLHKGDLIVLFLVVAGILFLLLRSFQHARIRGIGGQKPISGAVPKLLAENGYKVIAGEQRLPVEIEMGERTYESRLYIDYIAKKQEDIYLVAVSRPRKPLKVSGAALRDRFLAHFLAYKPAGILYVDRDGEKLKTITFSIADAHFSRSRRRALFTHLFSLGLGFILALILR